MKAKTTRVARFARNHLPDQVPFLPSYAEALAYFHGTKPYTKGAFKDERPLGSNRKYNRLRISMVKDIVAIKHYKSDIVLYYPDGSLYLATGGWDSISTAQAMQEVLGVERVQRVRTSVYYVHEGLYYLLGDGLNIDPGGKPLHPTTVSVHHVRKPVMDALRKQYAPLMVYAKQVCTMNTRFAVQEDSILQPSRFTDISLTVLRWENSYPSHSSANSNRITDRGNIKLREFFDVIDNTLALPEDQRLDAMYAIVQVLGAMFGYGGFQHSHCSFPRLKKGFEELLRFRFSAEIFEKVDAPIGKPVIDTNSKYVPTK
jgi:hypothetical protein